MVKPVLVICTCGLNPAPFLLHIMAEFPVFPLSAAHALHFTYPTALSFSASPITSECLLTVDLPLWFSVVLNLPDDKCRLTSCVLLPFHLATWLFPPENVASSPEKKSSGRNCINSQRVCVLMCVPCHVNHKHCTTNKEENRIFISLRPNLIRAPSGTEGYRWMDGSGIRPLAATASFPSMDADLSVHILSDWKWLRWEVYEMDPQDIKFKFSSIWLPRKVNVMNLLVKF